MSFTTSYTETLLFPIVQGGGDRGSKKRGDISGEAERRNVALVGEGVGVRRNVTAIGDIGLSKIDRGEAGRKGAAFGKRCCCSIGDLGGARNGFTGEPRLLSGQTPKVTACPDPSRIREAREGFHGWR